MNSMEFEQIRNNAMNKFNKLSQERIFCPALNLKIKFTNEGFSHLSYKDVKRHYRSKEEQKIRYWCFLFVEDVIKRSNFYQEYKTEEELITIKKNGIKSTEKRFVEYFWFVAVVKTKLEKIRIKVVVKYVQGFEYGEFKSVIPAWNITGYKNYFDSDE